MTDFCACKWASRGHRRTMLIPTVRNITGATYQSKASEDRWRAAKSPLLDRWAVCGPMFLSNHLCLSESCTGLPAMLPACSPTIFHRSIFRWGSVSLLSTTCSGHMHMYITHMAPVIQLGHGHVRLCCYHVSERGHPEYKLMRILLLTYYNQ